MAKIWTKRGLEALGEILREARKARGWSQRDLSQFVCQKTGYKISDRSIGNLENNTGEPKYNTVALIAASGFVINPATGMPFTEDDFINIACEVLDPFTGQYCEHYQHRGSFLLPNTVASSQPGKPLTVAVGETPLVHS